MKKQKKTGTAKKQGKGLSVRYLALAMAMTMLFGCAVGGTIAWLIADTDPVVNTFTYGDIDLKLEETKVDKDGNPVDKETVKPDGTIVPGGDGVDDKTKTGNEYEMVPGKEYLKDPAVTVLAGNEACWLFVKLEKEGNAVITNPDGSQTTYDFDNFLTYTIADGWAQLYEDGHFGQEDHEVEGVYYRFVGEDTDGIAADYDVLKDNQISVLPDVDKKMLNALDNNGQNAANAKYPKLTVTAYAVQYTGFEAEVTDGAASATNDQVNTAACKAWEAVCDQITPAVP